MKLKWANQYGTYRTWLKHDFELLVIWDSTVEPNGGYVVSACGVTLNKRARSVLEGQTLAVALAKRILTETLAQLNEAD